jgi:uncharacterized membrane protein YphA (DoxX/SURF4 family)
MSTRTSRISTILIKEDALMKLKMIGYWVTTIIVALELLAGGVTDLIHGPALLFVGDPVVLALAQLGYPVYLLTILGVWKLLGAIALLVPRFPRPGSANTWPVPSVVAPPGCSRPPGHCVQPP